MSNSKDSKDNLLSRDNLLSEQELDTLLNEWSKVKSQKSKLEEREEKIKKLVMDIMDKQDTNKLYSDNYEVTHREQKRSFISQKDLPEDLWEKYKKTTKFSVVTLKRL